MEFGDYRRSALRKGARKRACTIPVLFAFINQSHHHIHPKKKKTRKQITNHTTDIPGCVAEEPETDPATPSETSAHIGS
jgi:hypothetical protein